MIDLDLDTKTRMRLRISANIHGAVQRLRSARHGHKVKQGREIVGDMIADLLTPEEVTRLDKALADLEDVAAGWAP